MYVIQLGDMQTWVKLGLWVKPVSFSTLKLLVYVFVLVTLCRVDVYTFYLQLEGWS